MKYMPVLLATVALSLATVDVLVAGDPSVLTVCELDDSRSGVTLNDLLSLST